jgi:hypothetical protein
MIKAVEIRFLTASVVTCDLQSCPWMVKVDSRC